MPKLRNVTGLKFGRLTAIKICGKTANKHTLWELRCECGNNTIAEISHLVDGRRVSCGCSKIAGNQIKKNLGRHGHCRNEKSTTTYRIWSGMIARCTNKKCLNWESYGGKGVKVCDRWRIFDNFLADMGERPPKMSIDRINNDGDYEPSNCKWATDIEQHRNRSDNVFWTYNGETLTISGWAEKLGINRHTLADRVRKSKWSIEKALTTPIMESKYMADAMNKKRWGFERKINALNPPIPDTANCVNVVVQ